MDGVQLYVCAFMHMYIYLSIYICMCEHIRCTYVCLHIYICFSCACMYVCASEPFRGGVHPVAKLLTLSSRLKLDRPGYVLCPRLRVSSGAITLYTDLNSKADPMV